MTTTNALKTNALNIPQTSPEKEPLQTTGISNPRVVDEICPDTASKTVDLCIYQCQAWADYNLHELLQNLEDKFNNYLDYILDGYFSNQYPQYRGVKVNIALFHFEQIPSVLSKMLSIFENFVNQHGIGFKQELVNRDRLQQPTQGLQ